MSHKFRSMIIPILIVRVVWYLLLELFVYFWETVDPIEFIFALVDGDAAEILVVWFEFIAMPAKVFSKAKRRFGRDKDGSERGFGYAT